MTVQLRVGHEVDRCGQVVAGIVQARFSRILAPTPTQNLSWAFLANSRAYRRIETPD